MKRLVALALALTVAGTGCAPAGYGYRAHDGSHAERREERRAEAQADGIGALAGLAGLIINAATASSEDEDSSEPPAPETHVGYYGPPLPPVAPLVAPVTAADPPRRAFDQAAALAAVHGIDVNQCTDEGAPQGYGHARVTFGADGRTTAVVIDAPPGLSKKAVDCIGDAIGAASVPPFDGSPVTVGTTYYVK